jgi:hypothetical protein
MAIPYKGKKYAIKEKQKIEIPEHLCEETRYVFDNNHLNHLISNE